MIFPHGSVLVVDTNVVLALWMFADPALQPLREAIEAGDYNLLSRADALEELKLVLAYPQFALTTATQAALLADYVQRVRSLPIPTATERLMLDRLPACNDGDDQKFLEIAYLGSADYLLSRDRQLLKTGRKKPFKQHFQVIRPDPRAP